jgi:uncharacterized membrane protein
MRFHSEHNEKNPGGIFLAVLSAILLLTAVGCSGGPLTTREKGAGLGVLVGAGTGAIIGSTVGHAAVGAVIGGPVGLIVGALIGDQLMGQDQKQNEQQRQLDANQAEIERLRKENQQLKQQRE